jgi:signal transduction histidine kinase
MRRFQDLSIKRKLTASTIATTLIALFLASAAFMALYFISFKNAMIEDLSIKTEIVGINTSSAMLFNDVAAAEQTLSALKAEPDISAAYIFNETGRLFAKYHSKDHHGEHLPLPSTGEIAGEIRADGHRFDHGHLSLWKTITLDGRKVGKVYLRSEMTRLYSQFRQYLMAVLMILFLSAFISYIPASGFQRAISTPILDMAQKMKRVSLEKDYSVRIREKNTDEVGQLIRGFNEMLAQIETRDRTLEKHRETLEEEVTNRTAELSRTNQYLENVIDELRKAKQVAEMASIAKSDFLANMSHELRTPLNHIIGFTELVVAKHFGELNDTQEEYLTDVLTSSRHLLSLVNDVLDLSKVEAGKLELTISPVDLGHLLQNSLFMVKEKALKHGLRLSTDFNRIPEYIEADERKLKQIVYNLLSNAVKFTPDGGRVELTAHLMPDVSVLPIVPESKGDASWVKISVRDSGIGLEKEDLRRIFNPFEQVESARNRKFQGTGLGLALVSNLVALHGGQVWAESEGENKGTVVSFAIPANAEPKGPVSDAVNPPAEGII